MEATRSVTGKLLAAGRQGGRVMYRRLITLMFVIGLMLQLMPGIGNADATNMVVTEQPMLLTGFDRDLARQNGYTIIRLKNGDQVSVESQQLQAGQSDSELRAIASSIVPAKQEMMVTHGEITGSCGRSWIYLRDAGVRIGEVWLGFELNRAAVEYEAGYRLTGDDLTSDSGYGGVLNRRFRWEHREYEGVPHKGYYFAEVQYMTAYMLDGGICYSGLPTARSYIS